MSDIIVGRTNTGVETDLGTLRICRPGRVVANESSTSSARRTFAPRNASDNYYRLESDAPPAWRRGGYLAGVRCDGAWGEGEVSRIRPSGRGEGGKREHIPYDVCKVQCKLRRYVNTTAVSAFALVRAHTRSGT